MNDRQMITFEYGEVEQSINALIENLQNPKPILRQWASKVYIPAIRANIKSGGAGWPPYAKSTLERLQASGTSQVTKRGTVRANRRKRFKATLVKHARKLKKEGWSQAWQNKQDRLEKRLANYEKAIARANRYDEKVAQAKQRLEQTFAGDMKALRQIERARKIVRKDRERGRLGKRQSETQQLLKNMPGTIRPALKISEDGALLIIYSAAGPVGGAHNYGEGRDPMRQFLPPPDEQTHLATLGKMLEQRYDKAWAKGK